MKDVFSFLIKLTTIFLGSGLASLVAFYIAKEAKALPILVLNCLKERNLIKSTKLSSQSGLYEISLQEKIKLFSSHKEMKIIN
ncbi:MAG: hypothetical protein HYY52_03790 [Candidatus Melainabacteria bacterium]|nr:hypothetical protein [Candidatus Melainabacteria bacterium]